MKPLQLITILLFTTAAFTQCTNQPAKNETVNGNLQQQCVHRLTDVIVYDIFTPPVASRIYAYCNLAYYEALRMKDSGSISITKQLRGFDAMPVPAPGKNYDHTLAAVHAFFNTARALTFSKDSLTQTEDELLAAFKQNMPGDVYENSLLLGEQTAAVILKRAASDHYKETRGMPRYSVFKVKGQWEQTPPDYADAVEPNWRLLKPLRIDSAAAFAPAPPPAYSLDKNSVYYKELMEVFNTSKNITPVMDTIAHYWDDNPFVTEHRGHLMFATKKTTPGGHWMGIIAILCGQAKSGELQKAKIYALTSCAIFDAFISCWDEKYRSKMVRPITVIRENIEPEWNSFLQTPPFPEYTSGHSVITAAASTVLTHMIGDNTAFTDTTEMEYLGMKRHFSSINQAADEAGISRLYGGIHFRSAIEEGKKQGHHIGELYNLVFK
ncbi:MAG: vanadium-dependent haloperoxidase [Ferruginibacter sp.]